MAVLEEVVVTKQNSPTYLLNGREIDIWSEEYLYSHSKSPVDYIRERILECEKLGIDPFPDVVGKTLEKEMVKNALLSGSPILFKGARGYGKTTFSKAIAKLLPERLLAIKDCKINDDPTRPTCPACKAKILSGKVELTWIPRIWIRIPGDPMLTTRQLIGGISIQKIREGYDLDDPEVFIPGRALKANRGVGYFDELGAIPTSLQTLLHELFEEHQISTTDGDIVPFKVDAIEIASTNPANYRGINPIKEPLLDRMEQIEIGPPETLEDEIEIGKRNMYIVKVKKQPPNIPHWHLKILARIVRYARDKQKCEIAKKIETEPSCRATIKLFDHIKSLANRSGREVPLLADYGEAFETIKLALAGRIELAYGVKESKAVLIEQLAKQAIVKTCKEIYSELNEGEFKALYQELKKLNKIPIEIKTLRELRGKPEIDRIINRISKTANPSDEEYLAAIEIILHSMSICLPKLVEKTREGYIVKELRIDEAKV
jgi:magnesium chelatase subunit I